MHSHLVVVQLIREHPGNNVPDKRLNSSLMLANIKSGNLDEASKYMGVSNYMFAMCKLAHDI